MKLKMNENKIKKKLNRTKRESKNEHAKNK